MVGIVGVRRGNDMLRAIVRRHPAHLLGHFPGLRAIVDFRQDVAMNIDHLFAI